MPSNLPSPSLPISSGAWAYPGMLGIYLLAALSTLLMFGGNTTFSFLWLAGGPAVALILFRGTRLLWAALVAVVLGFLLLGQPFSAALSGALRHVVVLYVGLWILKREGHFNPDLASVGDFLRILIFAIGIGLMTAFIVQAQLWLGLPYPGAMSIMRRLAGTTLGFLIGLPLVLIWRRLPTDWWINRRTALEALLIVGLSLLVGQVVFLDWLHGSVGQVARGYWMFLFITWAAVRLGPHGAVLMIAMTAIQALIGAYQGSGFFSNDIAKTGLSNYFFYMLSLSAVGMALATYFAQKQSATQALKTYQLHLEDLVKERTAHIESLMVDPRVKTIFCLV